MSNPIGPKEPTDTLETSSPTSASVPKKGKTTRTSKTKEIEDKVPITFGFSPGFARKLKVVVSGLDESASNYVESRLSPIVKRDLKRILEEMS